LLRLIEVEEPYMKRTASILAGALLLAAASGVVAGDKKKCTADPAECKMKMKAKIEAKGWLGVELDKTEHEKVLVKKVFPDSPAAAAGFETGDVFVAVNGIDYYAKDEGTKTKMHEVWAPGNDVTFTVKRAGVEKKLDATLGKVPPEVAEEWMHEHMETHHADAHKHGKDKKKETKS
jgi:C-terminal processing protease CtpA/Prc